MGFVVSSLGASLFHLLFLISHLRCLVFRAFSYIGLLEHHHHYHHMKFQSVSEILIQEFLPAMRYTDTDGQYCMVCLCEFEEGEEVRWPINCRHVFHRCCLDRWMIEHDQGTCPLCRAQLFPDETVTGSTAFTERVWAAAGVPDSYTVVPSRVSWSPDIFHAFVSAY